LLVIIMTLLASFRVDTGIMGMASTDITKNILSFSRVLRAGTITPSVMLLTVRIKGNSART
jgi:hypothetical protein